MLSLDLSEVFRVATRKCMKIHGKVPTHLFLESDILNAHHQPNTSLRISPVQTSTNEELTLQEHSRDVNAAWKVWL